MGKIRSFQFAVILSVLACAATLMGANRFEVSGRNLPQGTTGAEISIRDDLETGRIDAGSALASLEAVTKAAENLRRNPNERLLLQRLFLNLKS